MVTLFGGHIIKYFLIFVFAVFYSNLEREREREREREYMWISTSQRVPRLYGAHVENSLNIHLTDIDHGEVGTLYQC
jgi:hypothetical protein